MQAHEVVRIPRALKQLVFDFPSFLYIRWLNLWHIWCLWSMKTASYLLRLWSLQYKQQWSWYSQPKYIVWWQPLNSQSNSLYQMETFSVRVHFSVVIYYLVSSKALNLPHWKWQFVSVIPQICCKIHSDTNDELWHNNTEWPHFYCDKCDTFTQLLYFSISFFVYCFWCWIFRSWKNTHTHSSID